MRNQGARETVGPGSFLDGVPSDGIIHAERENGWYLKIAEALAPLGSKAPSTLPDN